MRKRRERRNIVEGFVYVMGNRCMPGVFKVGVTASLPETRAKELFRGAGVPSPFVVKLSEFSSDIYLVEKNIHKALASMRVTPGREFFRIPLKDLRWEVFYWIEFVDQMPLEERAEL